MTTQDPNFIRKTFLLIDGAYFSNRTLHGERISNPDMTMETNHDHMRFEYLMIRNLISCFKAFRNENVNIIDNVMLTFDSESWRKKTEPHIPYYISPDEPVKYKENRVAQKEKSDIDWYAFTTAQNDFAAMIKDYIPTMKVDGMEADDLLYLISEHLSGLGHNVIILATDGDLEQLVNDRVTFFKDIRSKNSESGEIFMSKNNFDILFGSNINTEVTAKSLIDGFLDNLDKPNDVVYTNEMKRYLSDLNRVQTTGSIYKFVSRLPNVSTFIEKKNKTMFYKIVSGDKKDNIFPLLRWTATTGTRQYKCSERHIGKVLATLGYEDNNEDFGKLLDFENETTNFMLRNFLINLIMETKQENVQKNIMAHFQHNVKLNLLDKKYIPIQYQQYFHEEYIDLTQLPDININEIELELMKKDVGNAGGTSNATNILTEAASVLGGVDDILGDWKIQGNRDLN